MKRLNARFFLKNPDKYQEMLDLIAQGFSYLSIGRKFGLDHTTIIYHARMNGVKANTKRRKGRGGLNLFEEESPPEIEVPKKKEFKYKAILDEEVNHGLPSYKAYREVEESRNEKNKLARTGERVRTS